MKSSGNDEKSARHVCARPLGFRAFSMVELLIALAIGAAVITVGVLIFRNLGVGKGNARSYVTVDLGTAVMQNFYGENRATTDAWVAPNYGRRAYADLLRDLFWEDVSKASAVFCLGRSASVLNTTHPKTIPVDDSFQGQSLDLPDAFRALLEESIPASAGTFLSYRGASNARNLSIFILQPSANANVLSVLAVYDIDLITTTSPSGVYVSGRRYDGGTMTNFYDIFYPDTPDATFTPMAVAFERRARTAVSESAVYQRLKVAEERPFYFIWWPDPGVASLGATLTPTYGANDPRASYPNMGGRTSLFFAVPMFPAL